MSRQVHHCSAYGLHIRSEIPLPFRSAAREAEPDVTIRVGATPEALAPSADRFGPWQTVPGVYLLGVKGVARYLVTGGREIVVQPTGGSEARLQDYLVGPVLAACLRQRDLPRERHCDRRRGGPVCRPLRKRQIHPGGGPPRSRVPDAGR